MSNINVNRTFNQLNELVEYNINRRLDYMPDDFNEQQRYAIELFKNRIFLEEVIEETIFFNKNLSWENDNKNLKLISTAEDLIEVFKLRSDVFHSAGYGDVFSDTIEGLNFDKFDKNAAIIYYSCNNEVTATVRLIFDSSNKLPCDSIISFDNLRKQYNTIGELSRNAIKRQSNKLNLEFKYLMSGIHNVFSNNDIDMTVSGIKADNYKLCSKFGGVEILKDLGLFEKTNEESLIISWDLSKKSKFFDKAILNKK